MIADNRLGYATEQLVAVAEATEIELVVPSSFVPDVLVNSALVEGTIRPQFADWLRGVVHTFPDLDADARRTLLELIDQGTADNAHA